MTNHQCKWDFFRLMEAIMKIMPDPEVDTKSYVTIQYMADTRAYIRENGFFRVEEFLKKQLERSENSGITGRSGTGKSDFINTIRGLKHNDDGAVYVDVMETTTKATEYQHPDNPNIFFVDILSIGEWLKRKVLRGQPIQMCSMLLPYMVASSLSSHFSGDWCNSNSWHRKCF